MQKRKNLIVMAQVVVLVAFGLISAACYDQQKVVEVDKTNFEDYSKCLGEGYIFVGTFGSESEARSASLKMGFSDYCFSDGKCYGIK